jgi:Zn-dependent peptidase ImmA (M78 family)/transcriptional regulator with XRE-family HTH domain
MPTKQTTQPRGTSSGVFNREMFILAREAKALTQGQLAKATGTTQGRISKVETGTLDPTPELLESAARALRVPVAFFYKQEDLRGIPESYHRKRASLGVTVLRRINAEVNMRIWEVGRLLRAADFETKFELPALDLEDYGGSPEAVARAIRSFWQMPPGPVRNLARAMENAGAVLIPMKFGVREIDGIAMRPVGLPPLVFYNAASPGDRLRFTLAHELGHLVMHTHQAPYPKMEEEANAFAAELLMPERDIKPQLMAGVSRQTLAGLKPVWRVAMGALLYRAHQLKVIEYNRYTRLWQEFSKLGYRTREPAELDFPPEKPTVLDDLLKLHLEHFDYTMEELADALDALPDVVEETFLPNRPRLQLHSSAATTVRFMA